MAQENNTPTFNFSKKPTATLSNAQRARKQQQEREQNDAMKTASKIKANYCRHCNQLLPYALFQETTHRYLDTNGKLSICNNCLRKIFNEFFVAYNSDYPKAFFAWCKTVDMKYDEGAVAEVKAYIEGTKNATLSPCEKYRRCLALKNTAISQRFVDTKIENDYNNSFATTTDIDADRKIMWGDWSNSEYLYLEKTLSQYLKEYSQGGGVGEEDAFKTLSILLLRQRNEPANKDVTAALKNQMQLCGVTPEQLKKRNEEKGKLVLGMEAEIFELTTPIDVYCKPETYFDHDGLQRDMKEIKRSIKNFKTGSKDFQSDFDTTGVYDDSEE